MELDRIKKSLESSTLFLVLGPQEGGKTTLLKLIAKLLGENAVVVFLKEKQNEWRSLNLPSFRPTFKPEDLIEWGLSGVRHIETTRGGQVAPWRQIACHLLEEWGFKTPVCEGVSPMESGIMSWARAEFARFREYITLEPSVSKGGVMPIETYVDIIAVTISRLANYVNAEYLAIDDVAAQLGRFKITSWSLLQRNWFRVVVGQQIYQSRDIYELRELATASDAICLTPLAINGRTRWKPWHLLTLKELRIHLKPKNGKYVCLDDYGSYDVPFHEVIKLMS